MSKHIPLSQCLMGGHLSQVMTVVELSWIIINLLTQFDPQMVTSSASIPMSPMPMSLMSTMSTVINISVNNNIQNTSYHIHYNDQTQQPANHRSILKFKKRIHCLVNPQDQQVGFDRVFDGRIIHKIIRLIRHMWISSLTFKSTQVQNTQVNFINWIFIDAD